MSTVVKDLGAVSAYAYAVEKGYTGTESEFAELMADYAEVGQRAEDAANSALESKTAAQTAATTATNKASEAATSAQTATSKAGEATTAAGTATTAKNDAVAAKTAAETAQGKAENAQAAAESVAESIPSDYSQLSEDVSGLKEDLTGINYLNGYIVNNSGKIGGFTENASYRSKVIPVCAGEVYYINGTGTSSARLWSTHTSNKTTSRIADANTSAISTAVEITIQDGEKYLVFNTAAGATVYGVKNGAKSCSTFNTRDLIEDVRNHFDEINTTDSYTFKNNISTDGVGNLPNCTIVKDGVTSNDNYGLSGSRYTFNLPPKKFHLYFEYRQTSVIPSIQGQTADVKRLVTAFGNSYFIMQRAGSIYNGAELIHNVRIQCVSGSNANTLQLSNGAWYQRLQGEDAFYVQYTNEITQNSVCTLTFADTKCTVNVDGNTTDITVTATTSVSDLVDALNNISGIMASAIYSNGKTYGDLLPIVSKTAAAGSVINLILNSTLYNDTAYTDAPKVYIPLAFDDEWHSVEMIFDPDGRVSAALDGITVSVEFSGNVPNNYLMINQHNMPIVIRNLELDYNSAGDAEVIDALAMPSETAKKQLISSHNPRVLIYEGHGVDVCTDDDAPLTDEMACSTERLRILFDTALAKGYMPVTWEDVINWKLKGTTLPKRCFIMMFDDWRFENYVDYDKRKPFVDYNVKAGLAVITSAHALTDTYMINETTYTVQSIVDITMRAGWYCVSHTHSHERVRDYTPSENEARFKTDVLEADKYGIHSNILVYPQGEFNAMYLPTIKHSGFALGVTIVANSYNCKGANDYFLTRVELGTRAPLSTALYPLV